MDQAAEMPFYLRDAHLTVRKRSSVACQIELSKHSSDLLTGTATFLPSFLRLIHVYDVDIPVDRPGPVPPVSPVDLPCMQRCMHVKHAQSHSKA